MRESLYDLIFYMNLTPPAGWFGIVCSFGDVAVGFAD